MPTTNMFAIRRKIIGVLLQGARLRAARSKKECADVIGVTPGILTAYEEARRDISLAELELLAYYLHAPIRTFVEGEDDSLVVPDAPPSSQVLGLRNRIIGALLREIREQKKKSQKELAEAAGCSPRRIQQYEQGQLAVPLVQLEAMAEELGISAAYFLDEGVGAVGERELEDYQAKMFQALPEDVRAFIAQPTSTPYLRVAMHLAEMPAGTIRTLAEGLLDITY